MKIRTLAALVISGLFAVSVYAAPTSDMLDSDAAVAANDGNNIGAQNDAAMPADNTTLSSGTNTQQTNANDNSNSNDDMSADTATGDDDY